MIFDYDMNSLYMDMHGFDIDTLYDYDVEIDKFYDHEIKVKKVSPLIPEDLFRMD